MELSRLRHLPYADTSVSPRVLLLGDAKWVQGRWWDLGRSRLIEGANRAMQQALDLNDLLQRWRRSSKDELALVEGRFRMYRARRAIFPWKYIHFVVVVVPLLLVLLLSRSSRCMAWYEDLHYG